MCIRDRVAGDRLLLEQQPHAAAFNFAFKLVDLHLQRRDLLGERRFAGLNRLGGKRDGLLAQAAHLDELYMQLFELLVEFIAHVDGSFLNGFWVRGQRPAARLRRSRNAGHAVLASAKALACLLYTSRCV